jgi:hypothetical protein
MQAKVSYARFFALLNQLPHAKKEDLVWEYSHTVTTSLSEFQRIMPMEYVKMINDMQQMVDDISKRPEKLKRLRSDVLHRLQKHGVDTTDWSKVNAFMSQPRIAGKTLGEMNIVELRKLIPKLESILAKDKNRQAKYNHLTQSN